MKTLIPAAVSNSSLAQMWQDPKIRGWIAQALVVFITVLAIYEIAGNTAENLQRANIASGFGFLNNSSGFAINFTLIEYSPQSSYFRAFVVGVLNTLLISAIGIVLATLIGFSVGAARLSQNWLLARLAGTFVETLRNTPLLLQLFFWYFVVLNLLPSQKDSYSLLDAFFLNNRGFFFPRLVWAEGVLPYVLVGFAILLVMTVFACRYVGKRRPHEPWRQYFVVFQLLIFPPLFALGPLLAAEKLKIGLPWLSGFNFEGGINLIPEFIALLLALSIYTGAFIAEIVRSGIQSVPKGQVEAARALGLRPGVIMRKVIRPQAMRVIIPPLTSQYLNLTKNSSLAVAIAYPDLVLVFANTALSQIGQAVEIVLMTMAVYLFISLATSLFMNWYNARMRFKERGNE